MMTPNGQRADAVFEGGGVKGIGLVGALQAFEEAGFQWQNVAGTSAGAITAALVAAGYTAQETKKIMNERVDFHRFKDTAGIGRLPVLGPWLSLISSKGMYKGDYFLKLIRKLLSEKVGKDIVTFGDLIQPQEAGDSNEDYEKKYKYKLRVIASDISGNELLVLPQDIGRLGGIPDELEVALAVRMSMSIPFFFRPVVFGQGQHRKQKHWIMDGGMLSNFPIWLFDSAANEPPAWPTIGFLLWEPESAKPQEERIRGLVTMGLAMVRTMTSAHDRKALQDGDLSRIVKIPTGKYSTTDFDLTREDQDWLYNSGYQEAKAFLQSWSFSQYQAQQTPRGPRRA